jgi:hypothetical protein
MLNTDAPKGPDIHQLPDGSRLMTPQSTPTSDLRRDQWVRVDGEARRIADLRQNAGGGRIVHLDGHPPLSLTRADALPVYAVVPAPVRVSGVRR